MKNENITLIFHKNSYVTIHSPIKTSTKNGITIHYNYTYGSETTQFEQEVGWREATEFVSENLNTYFGMRKKKSKTI